MTSEDATRRALAARPVITIPIAPRGFVGLVIYESPLSSKTDPLTARVLDFIVDPTRIERIVHAPASEYLYREETHILLHTGEQRQVASPSHQSLLMMIDAAMRERLEGKPR